MFFGCRFHVKFALSTALSGVHQHLPFGRNKVIESEFCFYINLHLTLRPISVSIVQNDYHWFVNALSALCKSHHH